MVDSRFETWLSQASCADRCLAAERLCDVFSEGAGGAATADLVRLLERLAVDPSPKVRRVLASRLAADPNAPSTVIRLFCDDTDTIAALVVARTPCLRVEDLLDLVANGSSAVRTSIAARTPLCERLAEAIGATADPLACRALLCNPGAVLNALILRRIAALAAADPGLRELLIRRVDLPADIRHALALSVARALGSIELVQRTLGPLTPRITAESCDSAALVIARRVPTAELVAFSDQLRRSGQVSTMLLVRTACSGELDFFAAALAALSGLNPSRVRTTIVDARDAPFRSLLRSAGVPEAAQTILLIAVRAWKDAIAKGADVSNAEALVGVLDGITAAFRQTRPADGAGELSRVLARLRVAAARASVPAQCTLKRAA